MYYTREVFMDVDWSHRGGYVALKHGILPSEANEALRDPERLVIEPDPASKSGRSVRVIGWSHTHGAALTVIVLENDGIEYGVNAWPSSPTDQRRYFEEE